MSLDPSSHGSLSLVVCLNVHLLHNAAPPLKFPFFVSLSFLCDRGVVCDATMFFHTCRRALLASKHRDAEFYVWWKDVALANKPQLRFCLRCLLGERRSKLLDVFFPSSSSLPGRNILSTLQHNASSVVRRHHHPSPVTVGNFRLPNTWKLKWRQKYQLVLFSEK